MDIEVQRRKYCIPKSFASKHAIEFFLRRQFSATIDCEADENCKCYKLTVRLDAEFLFGDYVQLHAIAIVLRDSWNSYIILQNDMRFLTPQPSFPPLGFNSNWCSNRGAHPHGAEPMKVDQAIRSILIPSFESNETRVYSRDHRWAAAGISPQEAWKRKMLAVVAAKGCEIFYEYCLTQQTRSIVGNTIFVSFPKEMDPPISYPFEPHVYLRKTIKSVVDGSHHPLHTENFIQ